MKITAEPRSDQLNADDFVGRSATFTIAGVRVGKAEQKYDIDLVEVEGRAWRPPLTVLRLLLAAWGDEAGDWVGRKVTLYRDETVAFGKDVVGGIRVSHMSHLPDNKPFETRVTTKRGRRAPLRVEPIVESQPSPEPTAEQVAAETNIDTLTAMWQASGPERRQQIEARVAELRQGESAGGE